MTSEMQWIVRLASAIIVGVIGFGAITPMARAVPAGLKGTFQELKEPSTHTPGKVKLTEFADFYCPHCHMFEQGALPVLEKRVRGSAGSDDGGIPSDSGQAADRLRHVRTSQDDGQGDGDEAGAVPHHSHRPGADPGPADPRVAH